MKRRYNGQFKNDHEHLDEVEKEIFEILKRLVDEFDASGNSFSTSYLTKEIKVRFGNLGKEKNYGVSSTIHDGEWLFDLIWYSTNADYFSSLNLAVESELSDRSHGGLRLDFEKLLPCVADNKVFICFAEGHYDLPESVDTLISLFNQWANSYYHQLDSRILVLIWEDFNHNEVIPHLIKNSPS
ncbi:hypothetical protein JYT74_00025 [Crocinitomix catalasitica]|nr:hypothetical protein [Crocinitomix catalasitica]